MARLSKEDLLLRFKDYTKDRTDDETISLLEDFTDTLSGLGDVKEVEDKWRQRYKERFFEEIERGLKEKEDTKKEIKVISTDKLFKEEE